MPSDFIPAISRARREYIDAAGSLTLKHAAVSPLLCEAVFRPQAASQGFPTLLISPEFLCSGLEGNGFRGLTLSFRYCKNKNELAWLVLSGDRSGHVWRAIPQEIRADPGEQDEPPNRKFNAHPKLPSLKAPRFREDLGASYQENIKPKQLRRGPQGSMNGGDSVVSPSKTRGNPR